MLPYQPRFLLVVVCLFLLGSFLVQAGLLPADAGLDQALTLHASARNFLPVVYGQVPGSAPTPTSEPPAGTGDVRITKIFFDGVVPRVEADEYVQIENYDSKIIRLGGWRLHDAGQIHSYTFPAFAMDPGQVCRVYTNENHPEWCGFN